MADLTRIVLSVESEHPDKIRAASRHIVAAVGAMAAEEIDCELHVETVPGPEFLYDDHDCTEELKGTS